MTIPKQGLRRKPAAGTTVRLTGSFLRSTGQVAGGEGGKRWTVVECPCRSCDDRAWNSAHGGALVALNEPHGCQSDPRGYEDVPESERPRWRHVSAWNLEVVGSPPRAADCP